MIPRSECTHCQGEGRILRTLPLTPQTQASCYWTCEFCKGTGLVPPPGLEPGPREGADFESAASTNSTKGATAEGIYHGLSYPRKEEGYSPMTPTKPTQFKIGGGENIWLRPNVPMTAELLTMARRLRLLMADITLTNGWEVAAYYDDRGYFYLQVGAEDGTCNVTGKPVRWSGRKWLLSEHMTDAEIIQTALKAVLTAQEHEAREQFLFKGQAIFDPHYDLLKLVRLRSAEDALSERAEGATVSSHDDMAKDLPGAGNGVDRGAGASGTVHSDQPADGMTPRREDWHYDSDGYCDNPGRGY